jgi:hypothetical protein
MEISATNPEGNLLQTERGVTEFCGPYESASGQNVIQQPPREID